MLVKLPLGSEFYTADGKLRDDFKYSVNVDELKIRDSKIIGKPEDKFETMLFLPVGEGRKGEGGLRTRGYFKFSYKYIDKNWFICDIEGNPLKPAPADIQEKINSYIASLPEDVRHNVTELPLITVITVVLNGEKYLEQTIQSVINQTYPNVEYIIIDGGSTDGTLDIIKKYEDKIDYWVSEKDRGIYDAMNKGITVCIGDIIGIINADDFYSDENVFQEIINLYDNNYDIYYGNMKIIDRDKGQVIEERYANINKLYFGMYLNHPATFVKLKSYKTIGYFDSINFRIAADYDLILRNKINNSKFKYIDSFIVYMRDGGESIKNIQLTKQETEKARRNNLPYFTYKLTNFIKFIRKITK